MRCFYVQGMKRAFPFINFVLLLIFYLLWGAALWAQDDGAQSEEDITVAVVPFKGNPENIIIDFGEVLQEALPKVGAYSEYLVDMDNLPPDVPPGGFPPYVCPSPSMTNNSDYALTGEVTPDEDDPSTYHLRLYLWEMKDNRLIFSDELTAPDKESCEATLPSLLGWIFSWISQEQDAVAAAAEQLVEERLAAQGPAPAPTEPEPAVEPEPEKWLYVGLRAGSSLRLYSRDKADPFENREAMGFLYFNAALQASVHILSWFDVQAEANFTYDYAPYSAQIGAGVEDTPFTSTSLMLPILARFNLRRKPLMAGLLAGPYFILPLGQMSNSNSSAPLLYRDSFDYKLDLPLGYTVGFNLGMKLGPGWLFTDIRWAADLGPMVTGNGDQIYKRSMVMFNIGYEFGFIDKKKRTGSK